jgi:hypothetical protein
LQHPFERRYASATVPMPLFGKRRCCECDLGKGRQTLVDEPLEPAECRSLVTRRIGLRQQGLRFSA